MSPRLLGGSLALTNCEGCWSFDGDATDQSGNARHGTMQNLPRKNEALWSRDYSQTAWPRTGAGSSAVNAVGVDGLISASTVIDSDATARAQWTQVFAVPVDSNTHVISFFIKKDADVSRFPLLFATISGGTSVARATALNTSNGTILSNNAIGTTTQRLIDGSVCGFPAWWIVELTLTNNSTASNTVLTVGFAPAYGNVINISNVATTGSMVVGQVEVNLNAVWTNFPPIFTTTTAVTVSSTFVVGRAGLALSLDGLNDHVTVPDTAALKWTGQNFSFGGWAYREPTENPADGGYIISKPWNASGQYNYFVIVNADGTVSVQLLGATSYALTTPVGSPLTPGSFHHVMVTVEAATKIVSIYIDGLLSATGVHSIVSWVPTLGDANQALTIGNIFPYGTPWVGVVGLAFRGLLDDIRVYSRVLTPVEISQVAALYFAVQNESAEFVHLLEFQFDTGTIRLATGAQDLSWNNLQWEGIGGLLELGGVEETTDAKAQGVDVRLSGVDQTVLSVLLTSKYRGRPVKIWRAHLSRSTGLVLGTMLLFQGLQLSPYTVDEERSRTDGTVRISTRLSGYFGVERVRGIMTNLVSHQHYFSDIDAAKTAVTDAWDQQVRSEQSFVNGAFAQITAPAFPNEIMFGLNDDPFAGVSFTDLNYAIQLTITGVGGTALVSIWENNVQQSIAATAFVAGDIFSILYANGLVTYYKNGAVLRSVAAAVGQTLYFDSSFYGGSGNPTYGISKLKNIRFGPSTAWFRSAFVATSGVILTSSPDTFFQHAASLANVKVYWGTPVPMSPGSGTSPGDEYHRRRERTGH